MKLGKIIEVKGTRVVARLYEKLPSHLIEKNSVIAAPQINTYLKTRVGLDAIICQITGEILKLENNTLEEIGYMVELEVKGRITNGQFLGGLRLLPFVDSIIETLEKKDYEVLFSKTEQGITIGTNLFDDSNKIVLDINKLIPSHIGIFGNTGSGKSNTLVRILKEYINKVYMMPQKLKSKILIFDLNNEYGENAICGQENKYIYKLTTKTNNGDKIPFDFSKISFEDWGIILSATERTQLPVIKKALETSKQSFDTVNNSGVNLIKTILLNPSDANGQMFYNLRTHLQKFFNGLDFISYNKNTKGFYNYRTNNYTINDIISCISLKDISSGLKRFEFELLLEIVKRSESGINFEYISPLIHRMSTKSEELVKVFSSEDIEINEYENKLFNGKQICVIQLGRVNREIRSMLPSLLSNIFYDSRVDIKSDDKVDSIINIVIDEAHNLLSNQQEQTEIHDNNLKTFEKIIKEGRKFGIFLMIASQRPSDISNTITSQIHNYFIHKLVNPNDIEKIRKTVAYMNESSLNMLTVLGKGECIVSGTSLYIPQYVYVNELNKENKPNSEDIIIVGNNGILE